MKKEILKKYLKYLFSGLIFIVIAKISIDYKLFSEKIFKILFLESIFLSIYFLIYIFFIQKIKIVFVSKFLNYSLFSFLSLFVIEFIINGNSGFLEFLFLLFIRGAQGIISSSSISKRGYLRKNFLKSSLRAYMVYIISSFLIYISFSGFNIWGTAFVILSIYISIYYLYLIFKEKRDQKPKEKFREVAFY